MPRTKQKGSVTIVSLYPLKPSFSGSFTPLGFFEMEAAPDCAKHKQPVCAECLPYVTYTVEDRVEGIDLGFDRKMQNTVDAEDVAEDLIRDEHGFFIIKGEEPTVEELKAERAKMVAWLKAKLADSDDAWNRWHDRKMIPESARIACRVLGEQREWITDTTERAACPSCSKMLNPTAAKCECGAVLDWQRAYDLAMLTPTQEERGIAEGKIKTFYKPKAQKAATA